MMRATPSSPRSLTISVAPNSRASFCRGVWRLIADELAVLATGRVASLAVGAGVVRGEEGADDELPGLDRGDRVPDLLDDAAVLVSHRLRLGNRVDAAVVPQVGPADAGDRHPNDGIRRLDNLGGVSLLEPYVTTTMENRSSHRYFSLWRDPT